MFWPWSSLRMSACTVPRTLARAYAAQLGAPRLVGLAALLVAERVDLLVDGGVEEERQHGRRRAVDRHRHRRGRGDEVEAVVQRLHVLEGGHRDAGGADLAVDVGARVGVAAVEGHRVERGREPGRVAVRGEHLEAAVGAERVALAGEHPGRVLAVALEREDAGGEGEVAGQVLAAPEAHQLAVVGEAGQRDAGDLVARQRLAGQLGVDLLVADLHHLLVAGVGLHDRRPALDLVGDLVRERLAGRLEQAGDAVGRRRRPRRARRATSSSRCTRLAAAASSSVSRVVAADGLGDLGEVADPVGRARPGGCRRSGVRRRGAACPRSTGRPVLGEQVARGAGRAR